MIADGKARDASSWRTSVPLALLLVALALGATRLAPFVALGHHRQPAPSPRAPPPPPPPPPHAPPPARGHRWRAFRALLRRWLSRWFGRRICRQTDETAAATLAALEAAEALVGDVAGRAACQSAAASRASASASRRPLSRASGLVAAWRLHDAVRVDAGFALCLSQNDAHACVCDRGRSPLSGDALTADRPTCLLCASLACAGRASNLVLAAYMRALQPLLRRAAAALPKVADGQPAAEQRDDAVAGSPCAQPSRANFSSWRPDAPGLRRSRRPDSAIKSAPTASACAQRTM
jgi:hypothetical protein